MDPQNKRAGEKKKTALVREGTYDKQSLSTLFGVVLGRSGVSNRGGTWDRVNGVFLKPSKKTAVKSFGFSETVWKKKGAWGFSWGGSSPFSKGPNSRRCTRSAENLVARKNIPSGRSFLCW